MNHLANKLLDLYLNVTIMLSTYTLYILLNIKSLMHKLDTSSISICEKFYGAFLVISMYGILIFIILKYFNQIIYKALTFDISNDFVYIS